MEVINDNICFYDESLENCKDLENTYIIDFNSFKSIKHFLNSDKTRIRNIIGKNCTKESLPILKSAFISDRKKQIEYIYDYVCDDLDDKWENCKPCKFCNNRCIASQNKAFNQEYLSCCYSFKRNLFGNVRKVPCKYLGKDKKCTTKNISCKLFTCDYLERHSNFSTSYEDYKILKLFFNRKERLVIKYNFFRTREEVILKLLEVDHKPYLLYLFSLSFNIK